MKSSLLVALLVGCLVGLCSCLHRAKVYPSPVELVFTVKLNADVYSQSRIKKPPQFVIWIEDAKGETIRTVWVCERAGTGNWGAANTTRPVALPYWVSRWNIETQTEGLPSATNPVVDGTTGATPSSELAVAVSVPRGSEWVYFLEGNVSGDFNEAFAAEGKDGRRDRNGNGQPSIVYRGRITAIPGQRSTPELVGRTDQFEAVSEINPDLSGITTAKDVFTLIEAKAGQE